MHKREVETSSKVFISVTLQDIEEHLRQQDKARRKDYWLSGAFWGISFYVVGLLVFFQIVYGFLDLLAVSIGVAVVGLFRMTYSIYKFLRV